MFGPATERCPIAHLEVGLAIDDVDDGNKPALYERLERLIESCVCHGWNLARRMLRRRCRRITRVTAADSVAVLMPR